MNNMLHYQNSAMIIWESAFVNLTLTILNKLYHNLCRVKKAPPRENLIPLYTHLFVLVGLFVLALIVCSSWNIAGGSTETSQACRPRKS